MADLLDQAKDLPSFRVVPPGREIRPEDLTLPDGTRMVGPDGLLVPPARSFSMIVNAATRIYSYRFDEAMRDNFVAARAMRRDAFIESLLEERWLPSLNRRWQLEIDDDRDPGQVAVRDAMTELVKRIRNFVQFKRALLEASWYGRAGAQWAYHREPECKGRWGMAPRWDPLHGDSIQSTFDGHPAILLDTLTTGWYSTHGASWGPNGDLRPTDRGGTALVLHRPYWRDRFAIHTHIKRKADYFEGELAGSVQGFGLRGQVYWQYVVRTDALTWMLTYMQAVGQMDLLVFNYPAGDAAAKAQQEANARAISGKVAIICPRLPTGNWESVQQIKMNAEGLKALHELVSEYFDRNIERLVIGQSMSAGADNESGMGGTGRAKFAKATKDEILVYDANNLDDTITYDVLGPIKRYNFPKANFSVRFKSVLPNLEAKEKVNNGKILIESGVTIKADEFREAAGYSRPEPGDDVVAGQQPEQPGQSGGPSAGGPPQPGGQPPGPQSPPNGQPPGMMPPLPPPPNRTPALNAPRSPNPGATPDPPSVPPPPAIPPVRESGGNPPVPVPFDARPRVTPARVWSPGGGAWKYVLDQAEFDALTQYMGAGGSNTFIPRFEPAVPVNGDRTHYSTPRRPVLYGPAEDRARRVDLIVLPPGVSGTNCGNCRWITRRPDGATWCGNREVDLPVDEHHCCALWDSPGTSRPEQQEAVQYARPPEEYVTDHLGNEHADSGPGGGRFVSKGGGSGELPPIPVDWGDLPPIPVDWRSPPPPPQRPAAPPPAAPPRSSAPPTQPKPSTPPPATPAAPPSPEPKGRAAKSPHPASDARREQEGATGLARRALDAAIGNYDDDPDQSPRSLAAHLVGSWLGVYGAGGTPADLAPIERSLAAAGAERTGSPGETVPFKGGVHDSSGPVSTGQPVRVVRPGWAVRGDDGVLQLVPAKVEPVGGGRRPYAVDNPLVFAARPAPPVRYEVRHAPPGGITVAGIQFTGGQFIPSEVMAQASPQERAAIEGGQSGPAASPPSAPAVPPPPPPVDPDRAFGGGTQQPPTDHPEHLAAVYRRLPPAAHERLRTRLSRVVPGDVRSVTAAWYAGDQNPPPPGKQTPCYGFYDPASAVLYTAADAPNVDPAGVAAHEIGHALDQSDDRQFFDLSGSPEFMQAWRSELAGRQLTNYAAFDEVEGFAEFSRLVYSTDQGAREAQTRFPLCYAAFRKFGLV